MADFTATFKTNETCKAQFVTGNTIKSKFEPTSSVTDYSKLKNKPSINGIELIGNRTSVDLGVLSYLSATTEEWNSRVGYIPENNLICIYDDYKTVVDQEGNEQKIKGFKIGDGKAYLIDLPFVSEDVSDRLDDHITNYIIHTNAAEKALWSSKINCDGVVGETLIFS